MSDVSTVLQEDKKPLASLNVNYLNMGPVSPSSSDLRMLPFTLTNNNNTALCFNWSKGKIYVILMLILNYLSKIVTGKKYVVMRWCREK